MLWSDVAPDPTGRLRIAVLGEGPDVAITATALEGGLHALAEDGEVLVVECKTEDFKACIERLTASGFTGASISNPFKTEAAKLAKQFFVVKHGMGVANALKLGKNIYAQNTEVIAFSNQIRDLKPGRALVMGSGRAARSAVLSLFECGWRIRVWNRNVIRSRPMAMAFETYGQIELASQADPAGCSLIVNATPIGSKAGEQPPVQWTSAGSRTTAIDFVYRGVATEFLRSAAQRGFRTVDGRELMVEQAGLALEWWLSKPVDRQPMFAAIGFRKL